MGWGWKWGNCIPQTWEFNSGDLLFMTQAYSRREDELVASCVTVIYIYIYTTFFVLWFAFISIYTYKLCLQSYNLFLFDSMNMLECTKVSVCILYVQYFATSLANVCWYDCWKEMSPWSSVRVALSRISFGHLRWFNPSHVALQPEVWMSLTCVSGVPKRLLV